MDYLITGASGFIGRRLVGRLLALGHEVNYLGRKRSGTLDSRAAFHLWNPDEPPPLNSISRLDAIIHLAGEPVAQRWNDEVKQRIYSSRTEGTRKLVSAISELKHKPSVLVSASAVGYYGNRGDEILTEESTAGDDFLAKVCIDWEREASRAREFGLRVVIIRVSLALGREGGALKSMLSNRSSKPPCPGIRLPASFARAPRLSIDSHRSPVIPSAPITRANGTA